ncbi:MAG: hypothetical protein IBX69_01320, partial [Anaerolineales bacterium]|nr:hypothetical protein [Anaerolineales bacterium]
CHHELRHVFSAGHGEVDIIEFTIPSAWNDRLLSELIPDGCQPIALTRSGNAFLPSADSKLKQDDVLLISANQSAIDTLRIRLDEKRIV